MSAVGIIDIAAIQRFIAGSELKEIREASLQIEGYAQNPEGLFWKVAQRGGVEVIYAAGGNMAVRAATAEAVKGVFRAVSAGLLSSKGQLEAVAAVRSYDEGGLAAAFLEVGRDLEARKLTAPRNAAFELPAFTRVSPGRVEWPGVGPESPSHIDPDEADVRGFKQPTQFKDIVCDSDERLDMLGFVSMDGLGMGKRLSGWVSQQANGGVPDAQFLQDLRNVSESIKCRWAKAWQAVYQQVYEVFGSKERAIEHPMLTRASDGGLRTLWLKHDSDDVAFAPMRRIYQGGDDLSFVCDARISLSVTAAIMRELERPDRSLPAPFQQITTSAAVVMADSHFPYSRAMRLADEVRRRAKKGVKVAASTGPHPSFLTWHLNRQGAVSDDLLAGPNTMKPYLLGPDPADPDRLTWPHVDDALRALWKQFGDSRNKLKDLVVAAERGKGGAAVRRLLEARLSKQRSALAEIGHGINPDTGCDHNGATPLVDLGELFDIYFPLTAAGEPVS